MRSVIQLSVLRLLKKDRLMDIVWLLAGVAFFACSLGLMHLFGRLRAED